MTARPDPAPPASPAGGASPAAPAKAPIWKRCLYGTLVLIALAAIHHFDRSRATPHLAVVVVLLLGGLAAVELPAMLRSAGHRLRGPLFALFACGLLVGKALLLLGGGEPMADTLFALIGGMLLLSAIEVVIGEPEPGMARLGAQIHGLLYLTMYSFLLDVLLARTAPFGVDFAVFLVLASKANDIGGYLGGSLIGGRKLAPRVSPNKTWSGSIAGFALCIVVSLVGSYGFHVWQPGLAWLLVFAIGVAVATQFGDLAESLLKRACRTKDSAQLVPTFGGALDIIDSLVFAAPVGYWIVMRQLNFGPA